MKKIILRSLLWLFITWFGLMIIFMLFGDDLLYVSQFKGILVLGTFMGFMSSHLDKIFIWKKE